MRSLSLSFPYSLIKTQRLLVFPISLCISLDQKNPKVAHSIPGVASPPCFSLSPVAKEYPKGHLLSLCLSLARSIDGLPTATHPISKAKKQGIQTRRLGCKSRRWWDGVQICDLH
ncbi:hypothetical protein AMTRI_Chr04g184670 [Amborella trichopoda]